MGLGGTSGSSDAELLKAFVDNNWAASGFFARAVGSGVCEVVLPQDAAHLEYFVEDVVAAGCSNVVFSATEDEVKVDLYCDQGVAPHLRTSAITRVLKWILMAVAWLVSAFLAAGVQSVVMGAKNATRIDDVL
jgi:hypothetical protein